MIHSLIIVVFYSLKKSSFYLTIVLLLVYSILFKFLTFYVIYFSLTHQLGIISVRFLTLSFATLFILKFIYLPYRQFTIAFPGLWRFNFY